ncbi:unnamed protein product [Pylaiella littoralis]
MARQDSIARLVRPKDAAISCSHFWGYALLLAGIGGLIVGGILFIEWKGLGSFWVGLVAIATGIAGIHVTQAETSGGPSTGIYIFMSVITLGASLTSIMLSEGVVYLAVKVTAGNCFVGDDCPTDFCDSDSCVCWEPDGTAGCSDVGTVRYCIRYGGDSCSDIGDSESQLEVSFVILVLIAFFAFCSLLVSISTCFCCKRTIVQADSENAAPFR